MIEPGPGGQSYHFLLKSGIELQIEAVKAVTNKPIVGALFWKMPDQEPTQRERIPASTFRSRDARTNAAGMLRAVLEPQPGKRFRFEFAGIPEPNMAGPLPVGSFKQQYLSEPTVSEAVELNGGKAIRLRFVLQQKKWWAERLAAITPLALNHSVRRTIARARTAASTYTDSLSRGEKVGVRDRGKS